MPKNAYYFPHDCNARHDPKILKMRSQYKLEGLGLYWAIVEMMREQDNYLLPIDDGSVEGYSLDLNCTVELLNLFINDCITKFSLFQSDNHYLWSDSLLRRMAKFDDKSEQAKEAAFIRWNKDMPTQSERITDVLPTQSERINLTINKDITKKPDTNNADALPTQSDSNAIRIDKIRIDKSKTEKIIEIPDFVDRGLWDDFMEMRTKKRIPNTYRAKLLLINNLKEFKEHGYDVNKIIEQSIMRGWTGVFQPKDNDGTHQGNNQGNGNSKTDSSKNPDRFTGGKYGYMVQK